MKKMLIDVSHPEETLTIIASSNKDIDSIHHDYTLTKKGNIYRAFITSIEYSLQAVFVNFGSTRFGFITLDNIHPMYFKNEERHLDNLDRSQVLMVQIEKEERGTKGAFLTTYISLAGRYCVLMMESKHQSGGVSRKIVDNEERQRLKDIRGKLSIPEGLNIILRTAVANATEQDILKDYKALVKLWHQIIRRAEKVSPNKGKMPTMIYSEASGVLKSLRDLYTNDISEIAVSDIKALSEAKQIAQLFLGKKNIKIGLFNREDAMLFNGSGFEKHINDLASMRINLPSGGYITIHPTEALTAVDVNSAKMKGADNIEETALLTNCEAAKVASEHILKRNISGQIVIDFIDMYKEDHYKEVETIVKKIFAFDKARVKIQKISPLCLLELSRQRIGNSIYEWILSPTKNTLYHSFSYNVNFFARRALRAVIHRAPYEDNKTCRLCVSKQIALYIMQEKVRMLVEIENLYKISVKLSIVDEYGDNNMRMEWF